MATLITETPKLDVKASKEFLKKVELNLKTKSIPIPTPKIDMIIKKIIKDSV